MTDEQVKKGLECCANVTGVDGDLCHECPYQPSYIENADCRCLIKDALALINQLEKESADKERYTIELYNRAREAEREVKELKQKLIDFDKFGDMTTPMGLLPINAVGMRKLVDYCNSQSTEINRLESDLYCAEAKAQGKTAKDILQSLAQFRAVSPTLSKTWYALAEKYGVEVDE